MSWIRNNLSKKRAGPKMLNLDINTSPSIPLNNVIIENNNMVLIEPYCGEQLKCFDYIDAILYINLTHRVDRNNHILNELSKICNDTTKIHRIDAIRKTVGPLGCGLSHIKSLEYALSHSKWNRVLILEDDFTFKSNNPKEISDKIVLLLENSVDMNVGLLSFNHDFIKYSDTDHISVKKVHFSQTASSYIITREYIPILLENMKNAMADMEKNGKRHENCIDVHWGSLQLRDNWYTIFPAIGHQYDNFSDNENKFTDYGC